MIVLIVAGLAILLIVSSYLTPKSLEIENITPNNDNLNITEDGKADLHFDIKSNVNQTWINPIVEPKVVNDNGNYLQVNNLPYDAPITGKGGNTEPLDMAFSATNSEGSLLKYKVYLQLYSNGTSDILDNKTITVTILPLQSDILPRQTSYSQDIKFDNISSDPIQIKAGESKSITFDILGVGDGTYSNIAVKPEIVHSSQKYLMSTEKDFSGNITKGQRIGSQTIQIEAIQSEGDELDYQVYLDLYANGQLMDSYPVNVAILSQ